ncbi:hypothetical protein NECAME_16491 [Necator americanus]|uniref:Uncharacterized protein n=1 Tax=Necator americanus TaxID=51031 RepID=W2TW45_NECAM|nr:hypothetical protein NECAME_16491 [Necator americanus]ETN86078.1 hypothetical protein NECAME_16491 [Necator americanus]
MSAKPFQGFLETTFSVKLHRQKNVLLIAGALLAFTAFVGVTYINYRTTSLYSSRSSLDSTYSRNRVSRQTVDTQTSTSSLHAYFDSRTPLTNIHAV